MSSEREDHKGPTPARALLIIPIVVILGVIAFVGVKAASPSAAARTNVDSRFDIASDAASAQYSTDTTATATVANAAAAVAPATTTATTTTATTTTAATAGSTPGLGRTSTTGVRSGTKTTSAGGSGTSPAADATGESVSTQQCGVPIWSDQTTEGVHFNGQSGDIGFYGDWNTGTNHVSGVSDTLVGLTDARYPYAASESVFNNSITAGEAGFDWNTRVTVGHYVSYCQFWPVDPWSRWGVEIYCDQSSPCSGTAVAKSEDPAEENKLTAVTGSTRYTIPAHKLALVHLTLNHLGGSLLTQDNGELSGVLGATTPAGGTAQRNFTIYYVRCVVWGNPKNPSQSLEGKFPGSSIAKAYHEAGLRKLIPNWAGRDATARCSAPRSSSQ